MGLRYPFPELGVRRKVRALCHLKPHMELFPSSEKRDYPGMGKKRRKVRVVLSGDAQHTREEDCQVLRVRVGGAVPPGLRASPDCLSFSLSAGATEYGAPGPGGTVCSNPEGI